MKFLLAALTLWVCISPAFAATIHIVLPADSDNYLEAKEQLISKIQQKGIKTQIHATQLADFQPEHTAKGDLIITIGNQAAKHFTSLNLQQSIIYSFSSSQVLPARGNWLATVLSQPIPRMINVVKPLIEGQFKDQILVALSQDNHNANTQLSEYVKQEKNTLDIIQVPTNEKPAKYIEDALFNAGALIAIDDNQVWNGENARWMLYQAYRYKVPVIGYSKRFIKAGALLAIYSNIEQVAATTAKHVELWSIKGKLSHTGVVYSDYNIEYNPNIAHALSINTPEDQFNVSIEQ